LVITTVEGIKAGHLTPQPQTFNANLKTAYKLNKDNCKIDWSQEASSIYNKIRGLNPFPAAWTKLHNGDHKTSAKIFDCELELTAHDQPTGIIRQTKTQLWVYVKNGIIKVNEIQLENKKRLAVKALLNGYQFDNNSIMV
jgi:methionyl-tRNA formyltransferase